MHETLACTVPSCVYIVHTIPLVLKQELITRLWGGGGNSSQAICPPPKYRLFNQHAVAAIVDGFDTDADDKEAHWKAWMTSPELSTERHVTWLSWI